MATGLPILYRDESLVAVAKPAGLVVHRSALAGDRHNCMRVLRDALGQWVWPVHRLDRGTSGVLVFALDPATANALAAAFARREVRKDYLAVVRGVPPESGSASRAAEPGVRTAFRVLARTELPYPVGRYPGARFALVLATPEGGRTHQVRRHLASAAHPVVGDVTHGDGRQNRLFRERLGVRRLLLHAWRLRLAHPGTGAPLLLEAPPGPDLDPLLASLGWADWRAAALAGL